MEWRTPYLIATVAGPGTQRPPPEPQTAEEKRAAEDYSAAMSIALDRRDSKDPFIGQRMRIISGPSKGLVGTLRDVTSRDMWQIELDARLMNTAALHLFQRDEVAFMPGIP